MKAVNTHGYKMTRLRKAAAATKDTSPYGAYVQLAYNTDTGEVIARWHLNQGSWVMHRDLAVIHIDNIKRPATQQEIADLINQRLWQWNRAKECMACCQ